MSSSQTIRFALVDVFTETPLAGIPLAVVRDAESLDPAVLAIIAREFNQPATTFLLPPTRPVADWRLRSFTRVGRELLGQGHHAMGAWWCLAASGRLRLQEPHTQFHQQLGTQVLPLAIEAEDGRPVSIDIPQALPTFGLIVGGDRASLASALGLSPVALGPRELPPQVVSTGIPHLLVPVAPSALRRLRPDRERLRDLLVRAGARGCYVFSPTAGDPSAATTRFFDPTLGLREEPATPSAAASLACYLRYHGALDRGHLRIAQGAETGRPSDIEIELRDDAVVLRGRAVVFASGVLEVPANMASHRTDAIVTLGAS